MNPQYEQLRASITGEDTLAVFDVLQKHVGYEKAISITEIASEVFHSRSDNAVRKARDIIEDLRNSGIAVCSTSGKPGRWLAADENEKAQCLADFRARRASIDAVIKALERAQVPPPAQLTEKPHEYQMSFL